MKTIKNQLLFTLKKSKWLLLFGIVFILVSLIIDTIIPFLEQTLIDDGIFKSSYVIITHYSVLLVCAFLLVYLLNIICIGFFSRISRKFIENINAVVLKALFKKNEDYFDENKSGGIVSRISEVWNLNDLFTPELFQQFIEIIKLLIAISVLLKISVFITLIICCFVIIMSLLYKLSIKIIHNFTNNSLDANIELSSQLTETVNGIREIKLLNADIFFQRKIEENMSYKTNIIQSFTVKSSAINDLISTISSILMIAILYFAGLKIADSIMTIGTYTLLVNYTQRLLSPILGVQSAYTQLQPIISVLKRLGNFIDESNETHKKDLFKKKLDTVEKIALINLSFKYPNSCKDVINNVNVTFTKGLSIIKGKNGAGKSTLIKIIAGRCDYHGEVKYDSIEVKNLNNTELLSVISQRPFLFNMSIMDNIILDKQFDEDKYNEVLNFLNFKDYYSEEQLKLNITENGHSLSGGQIKLISLARALYRNCHILIMDELCANLDKKAIGIVESMITGLKKDHILILIEHSDILDHLADEIITLEGGSISV